MSSEEPAHLPQTHPDEFLSVHIPIGNYGHIYIHKTNGTFTASLYQIDDPRLYQISSKGHYNIAAVTGDVYSNSILYFICDDYLTGSIEYNELSPPIVELYGRAFNASPTSTVLDFKCTYEHGKNYLLCSNGLSISYIDTKTRVIKQIPYDNMKFIIMEDGPSITIDGFFMWNQSFLMYHEINNKDKRKQYRLGKEKQIENVIVTNDFPLKEMHGGRTIEDTVWCSCSIVLQVIYNTGDNEKFEFYRGHLTRYIPKGSTSNKLKREK